MERCCRVVGECFVEYGSDLEAQRRKPKTIDITENDALTRRQYIIIKTLKWVKKRESPQTPEQLQYVWICQTLFPDIQGLLQHSDPATTVCSESSSIQMDNKNSSEQSERCRQYFPLLPISHVAYSIYSAPHYTILLCQN